MRDAVDAARADAGLTGFYQLAVPVKVRGSVAGGGGGVLPLFLELVLGRHFPSTSLSS